MMTTCCEWLSNLLQRSGEQGTAVIAVRDGEVRQLYVQARALTQWQEKTWNQLLHTEPLQTHIDPLFRNENGGLVAIATEMRIPIFFCPHCGSNLDKLIKRQREEFDKLAEAHRLFIET